MSNTLVIVNCAQLVTLSGPQRPRVGAELCELGIIANGALLVRDGRIEAVGARREIESLIDDDCVVMDACGRVVLPGFVDAHAHPVFAGTRADEFEQRARRATYVELIINEMLPRVAEEKLAEYCDVFCEEKVFTTDEAWRILSAARCHGLGLRVHADQLSRSGGAQLAAELGATTADHLEHTDAAGITALKSANVQPVLLPGSVYALGATRYPAAREMIDAGLAVVLATDFNPGSSPTTSMLLVLSLASTNMKMTPAEAITATTINAAYSLG